MSGNIYRRLQRQLDQYSIGYPETKSGVEIKILRQLFTETEAALFLDLSLQLEDPSAVAKRTGQEPGKVAALLDEMSQKGLIFRHRRKDAVRFAAAPFVLGIYEYQLKLMDRELAEHVDTYFEEGYFSSIADSIPLLRTIPVNKSIDSTMIVAPYFDAKKIVAQKKKIAVSDCICRIQKKHIDQNCDRPMEACFQFGSSADYYVENGLGRYVSEEEAMEILTQCEEAGLVNQVASAINPGGMCNCCGDCCAALIAVKRLPKPAEFVMNNYYASVEKEKCESCSICHDRCQMDAIFMDQEDIANVDLNRCIGCGLCITSCPAEALELKRKPEKDCVTPPATPMELMMETARKRETSLIPLSIQK